MKRILTTLLATVGSIVAGAAPAMAQSYPPDEPELPSIITGNDPGTFPVTGMEVSVWMLIAGGLIVAGLVALFLGRRRATVSA